MIVDCRDAMFCAYKYRIAPWHDCNDLPRLRRKILRLYNRIYYLRFIGKRLFACKLFCPLSKSKIVNRNSSF